MLKLRHELRRASLLPCRHDLHILVLAIEERDEQNQDDHEAAQFKLVVFVVPLRLVAEELLDLVPDALAVSYLGHSHVEVIHFYAFFGYIGGIASKRHALFIIFDSLVSHNE